MRKSEWKCVISGMLAMMLVLGNIPVTAWAADDTTCLCAHHEAHLDCGYEEGVSDCNYVCEVCNADLEATEEAKPVCTGSVVCAAENHIDDCRKKLVGADVFGIVTSEEAIEILKALEGYSKYAYYDYGKYCIGYGMQVEKDSYPNGITREEADALLRRYLEEVADEAVNNFANTNNLNLTQYQYDALVVFSFQYGYSWMTDSDNNFRSAVLQGKTGNEFIDAMAQCQGDTLPGGFNIGMIRRRLVEANMYLNNCYSTSVPNNYTYVRLDGDGDGKYEKFQAYDSDSPTTINYIPTKFNNTFCGWVKADDTDTIISVLDATTALDDLCAVWESRSGTCGENLTWVLDDGGTLTISGTGEMYDYSYGDAPWYNYCNTIQSVILVNGVTTIGAYAFCACDNLTSVVVPGSVFSIGHNAFLWCDSLTSIEIPESVSYIGSGAFSYCDNLTGIYVHPDNAKYCNDDKGVLYTKDYSKLLAAPGAMVGKYLIPDGVTVIGENAFFGCHSLTSVVISEGVTAIEHQAFCYCDNLTSVEMPSSMTHIGSRAFDSCYNLTSLEIPESVTYIGYYAFRSCRTLTNIEFPQGISHIGDGAISDCDNLTGLYVHPDNLAYCNDDDGVIYTKDYTKLVSASGALTDQYRIPDGVNIIGDSAFYGCSELTSIVIPEGVTSIEYQAFRFCSSLMSVAIPESVTSISDSAFYTSSEIMDIYYAGNADSWSKLDPYCPTAKYIHYSCTVTENHWRTVSVDPTCTMYGYTFEMCDCGYESEENNIVEALGHMEVIDDAVPATCTKTGLTAGKHCSVCKEALVAQEVVPVIPHSYEDLVCINCGTAAPSEGYCGDNLTWKLDDAGRLTISGTGDMWSFAHDDAPWYPRRMEIQSAWIETGVTDIGSNAFRNCSVLESIVIPEGVLSIDYYAFAGCTNLVRINIPKSVNWIEPSAFLTCEKLSGIYVHPNNEAYCNDSYGVLYTKDRTKLVTAPPSLSGEYKIYDGVTSIDKFAFFGCAGLTSVNIPNGVTSIGFASFSGCSGLTVIVIPETVICIDIVAFSNCSNLTNIVLPESMTSIGAHAFNNCSSLTRIELPQGITEIGDATFSNCSSLTNIVIPDSVNTIGEGAFYSCSSLTNIVVPDGVTHICSNAFACCSSLTSIVIPSSVSDLCPDSFLNCTNIQDIYFDGTPDGWIKLRDNCPFAKYIHYSCQNPEIHWEKVSIEPTCTEAGYTSEVCACGFQRNIKPYSAKGHKYENGECRNCGAAVPVATLANVTVTKTLGHTTGVILYWNAVEYGDIYQIYRLNGSSWELLKNTRAFAYKDETAKPGVKHYYKVIARNGSIKSDIKTTYSVSAVRPAANLANVVISKTVGHTSGNILYWDAVDGAKLYQIYRLDSGAWTLLKNTGSLAYKDETAPVGVKSYYKIVARNGDIKSNIATTSSTGVLRPAAAVTKLDNVTITQIKAHSSGNILYWNAVENAKVYQVYRLENGKWALLKNTGSLGYKDETAPVGVKCYYKIVARNGDIKSDIATTTSASATRP